MGALTRRIVTVCMIKEYAVKDYQDAFHFRRLDNDYVLPCTPCPDAFFATESPNDSQSYVPYDVLESLCDSCPLVKECLALALLSNERDGWWGGMSAIKREPLRRKVHGVKDASASFKRGLEETLGLAV